MSYRRARAGLGGNANQVGTGVNVSEGNISGGRVVNLGTQGDVVEGVGGDFVKGVGGDIIKGVQGNINKSGRDIIGGDRGGDGGNSYSGGYGGAGGQAKGNYGWN